MEEKKFKKTNILWGIILLGLFSSVVWLVVNNFVIAPPCITLENFQPTKIKFHPIIGNQPATWAKGYCVYLPKHLQKKYKISFFWVDKNTAQKKFGYDPRNFVGIISKVDLKINHELNVYVPLPEPFESLQTINQP